MYSDAKRIVVWLAMSVVAVLIGGCSFHYAKGRKAIFLSAFIPWTLFLIFNLYSEHYAQDNQIMKGSWVAFQLIFGTLVAIIGAVGGWIISRFWRKTNK